MPDDILALARKCGAITLGIPDISPDTIVGFSPAQLCSFVEAIREKDARRFATVGWAGRFKDGRTYLTPHQFEADKWRRDGLAVWTTFARSDCTCPACARGELHTSDCAVHNEPAMPSGPCDCGGALGEPKELAEGSV